MELHGSFARTGTGHGTDRAIAAGLLGYQPDDERIREALDHAERAGMTVTFDNTKAARRAPSEHHQNHGAA